MEKKIESIYVFGVGAAGSNLLLNLIYAYPIFEFTAIDFDKVELRNYDAGTQPYSKTDLNRPKVQAIQRVISSLKNKKINGVNRRISSVKDIQEIVKDKDNSLIIDAFDNAESRNIFRKLKDYNILHIGFSPLLTGALTWNENFEEMNASKSDKDVDICVMTAARPFILALTSISTILIQSFIDNGKKQNMYFDVHMNLKKF
jgi:hypothetical protein